MKNREKYKNELIKAIREDFDLCKFVKNHEVFRMIGKDIESYCEIDCVACGTALQLWLDEECEEPPKPEVDWSKVPVDTLVWVRDFISDEWSEHLWKAKRYSDNFEAFYKRKTGLLLYGSVGTGKTHVAACVANALIDKGYKVRMTNFGSIVSKLQESFQGRQKYIDDLAENYNLLIIDDLGAERQSEFMKEQIFNVIDSRYRSGKPMIVTTNLTAEQLKKPEDVASGRIYDRILERCHPLKIDGESMRRKKLREDFGEIEAMLKGEKQ